MASEDFVYRASTTAPVNIAVIKYWGKRDAALNLPTNSSLSVTLNQRDLRTHTTASCSATFTQDSLLLNGSPQDISGARTQACLRELRALRKQLELSKPELPPLSSYNLRIVSINNFPTAAGLASSAAGFAALVRAIADLYELKNSPEELSRIARQGSGSACRSLFGGYVAWYMGERENGTDSMASAVASAAHWPEMRALIVVASDVQKDVSSTAGMQATVKTSPLFETRARDVVPQRMKQMEAAIEVKDFSSFALLCMRDSNNFHATCADAFPPIFYLNSTSHAAIRMVEAINAAAGEMICAYTFDAGPNAVIFFEEQWSNWVIGSFRAVLGNVPGWKGPAEAMSVGEAIKVDDRVKAALKQGVRSVIPTGVGPGPMKADTHLIAENGSLVKKKS